MLEWLSEGHGTGKLLDISHLDCPVRYASIEDDILLLFQTSDYFVNSSTRTLWLSCLQSISKLLVPCIPILKGREELVDGPPRAVL